MLGATGIVWFTSAASAGFATTIAATRMLAVASNEAATDDFARRVLRQVDGGVRVSRIGFFGRLGYGGGHFGQQIEKSL